MLVGHGCTCADFERGQAPDGWCAHRIAAGIAKRVGELTPPAPEPPAPVGSLPEAAFSLTLKGTLGGIDALLTVRGQSTAEFQANLATVRGLLDPRSTPPPAQTARPPQVPQEGYCLVHEQPMQENLKDGRRWFSHKTADGWCKGKMK